jgi:alpha/beta superfamily hydrolase
MFEPCPALEFIVERVRIPAPPDSLEGELLYPAEGNPYGAVVLAGPHPFLGGTMHNNVVRSLSDDLAGRGLSCLRFNYRGPFEGSGQTKDLADQLANFWRFSRLPGEQDHAKELHAAINFLRGVIGEQLPLALIGYSFGCTLLPSAGFWHNADLLIALAPTLRTHDLAGFHELPQPKLIVAPQGDFATDEDRLAVWLDHLREPCELVRPWLDGHFFRGHESWLADTVGSFVERQWGSRRWHL